MARYRRKRTYVWMSDSFVNGGANPGANKGLRLSGEDFTGVSIPSPEFTIIRTVGSVALHNGTNTPNNGAFLIATPEYQRLSSSDLNLMFTNYGSNTESDNFMVCLPWALDDGMQWIWNFDQRGKRRMHRGSELHTGLFTSVGAGIAISYHIRWLCEFA